MRRLFAGVRSAARAARPRMPPMHATKRNAHTIEKLEMSARRFMPTARTSLAVVAGVGFLLGLNTDVLANPLKLAWTHFRVVLMPPKANMPEPNPVLGGALPRPAFAASLEAFIRVGDRRIAVVEGPSGAGKSTTVPYIVQAAARGPVLLHSARNFDGPDPGVVIDSLFGSTSFLLAASSWPSKDLVTNALRRRAEAGLHPPIAIIDDIQEIFDMNHAAAEKLIKFLLENVINGHLQVVVIAPRPIATALRQVSGVASRMKAPAVEGDARKPLSVDAACSLVGTVGTQMADVCSCITYPDPVGTAERLESAVSHVADAVSALPAHSRSTAFAVLSCMAHRQQAVLHARLRQCGRCPPPTGGNVEDKEREVILQALREEHIIKPSHIQQLQGVSESGITLNSPLIVNAILRYEARQHEPK